MAREARKVTLSDKERANLEKQVCKETQEQRMIPRLNIVLLASGNLETKEIAKKLGLSQKTVSKWRGRYAEHGLAGLKDSERPGRPWTFSHENREEKLSEYKLCNHS